MLLDDIYLYYTDSTGRQKSYDVTIEAANSFPFKVSLPSGIFLYKISWPEPNDTTTTTTLIKNRRYLGDTLFNYRGQTYDCVAFEVRELVEVEQEGVLEQEFSGLEFYAKGIGLVYQKKQVTSELGFEYALARTYPMDTLETIFEEYYDDGPE